MTTINNTSNLTVYGAAKLADDIDATLDPANRSVLAFAISEPGPLSMINCARQLGIRS